MRDPSAEGFRQRLLQKFTLSPKARALIESPDHSTLIRPLRELWEGTDLTAAEFADELVDVPAASAVAREALTQLIGPRAQ